MNCIVASTSTLHGSRYLEYLQKPLKKLFDGAGEILFIPYARPGGISHEEYTQIARKGLSSICENIVGLHEKEDSKEAIRKAEAVFTGGGNTFLLVKQLYQHKLMEDLKKAIQGGTAYLGTSAGSNICGQSMQNTNDMPIVYPPSFKTMGIIPFNINAHYLDPEPDSKHMGETRETRIKEFHKLNKTPVLGLREGSWLEVKNKGIWLRGNLSARLFEAEKPAREIESGSKINL